MSEKILVDLAIQITGGLAVAVIYDWLKDIQGGKPAIRMRGIPALLLGILWLTLVGLSFAGWLLLPDLIGPPLGWRDGGSASGTITWSSAVIGAVAVLFTGLWQWSRKATLRARFAWQSGSRVERGSRTRHTA